MSVFWVAKTLTDLFYRLTLKEIYPHSFVVMSSTEDKGWHDRKTFAETVITTVHLQHKIFL